jgi:hypothetical protein
MRRSEMSQIAKTQTICKIVENFEIFYGSENPIEPNRERDNFVWNSVGKTTHIRP